MNLQVIIDILTTGVIGLLGIVMAGYIVAMLVQAGRELWRRGQEKRRYPFELVRDERYKTPATIQPQAMERNAEYFRPLHVKAGK